MKRSPRLASVLLLASTLFPGPSADPSDESSPPIFTSTLGLVPWPRSVEAQGGSLALGVDSGIVAEDPTLRPLAEVLAAEIEALTGLRLEARTGSSGKGDIALALAPDLARAGEEHRVRVDTQALVEGGRYDAVCLGTATLVQLLKPTAAGISIPRVLVRDAPHSSYRGLLVDVARSYHSVETLKACVQLCRLYKIRYLQLHLTDDQAFTFPSSAFPLLTAQNHHGGPAYTLGELEELERYASERGVALVPELEVPGHAAAMNRAMPELFKIRGTRPYEHHATIHFASHAVLEALDTIVGEMCAVFRTSPYFHIGGDEADFAFAHQHPDFQAAFREHGLGEKGQWQLYRLFLIRMHEIVKRHGKKMLVWEGFHPEPESKFQIPDDVTVMEYECPFYPPELLIRDQRTFVNAAWTPLYVVNGQRWSPERIYGWNLYLLGQHGRNWSTIAWHQLEPSPLVIGAQMCAWEQPQFIEVPSLRHRLPAMSERIWNPDAGRTYEDYARRARSVDRIFSKLAPSVALEAHGLGDPGEDSHDVPVFHAPLRLAMRAEGKKATEIRYTLDGQAPTSSSLKYSEPLTISKTTTVRAAAFDSQGSRAGLETGEVFYFRPKPEPDLATGKPVKASDGTQWPQRPEFAVDGKIDDPHDSWWASPAPQWLQVDLEQVFKIDRVEVFPYWDGSRFYQYTVEVSTDGHTFTRIVDKTENTSPARPSGDRFDVSTIDARYVRVNLLKNSANPAVHLVELRVHEAKSQ